MLLDGAWKKSGEAGIPMVFSSGSSPRERGLLEELKPGNRPGDFAHFGKFG